MLDKVPLRTAAGQSETFVETAKRQNIAASEPLHLATIGIALKGVGQGLGSIKVLSAPNEVRSDLVHKLERNPAGLMKVTNSRIMSFFKLPFQTLNSQGWRCVRHLNESIGVFVPIPEIVEE